MRNQMGYVKAELLICVIAEGERVDNAGINFRRIATHSWHWERWRFPGLGLYHPLQRVCRVANIEQ